MKPDFTSIPYGFDELAGRPTAEAAAGAAWQTREHIEVAPAYGPEDVEGLASLDELPGMPHFLRGPYATMYAARPWTIRQYAGFSTAEKSNAFYRRNLADGSAAACRWRSTLQRTGATTATTHGWTEMSAWPASPSIRSWTCGSCSTRIPARSRYRCP